MIILEPLNSHHLATAGIERLISEFGPLIFNIEPEGGIVRTIVSHNGPIGVAIIHADTEVMIAIDEDHQGQGSATEALNQLKLIAFEKGFRSMKATTLIGRQSNGLLQKIGAKEVARTSEEIFYVIELSDPRLVPGG